MIFQHFPSTKVLELKFDLAVKRSKVTNDSGFVYDRIFIRLAEFYHEKKKWKLLFWKILVVFIYLLKT